MQLQRGVQQVFIQLSDSLDRLTPEQYREAIPTLFNASIGQHVRHILELFLCLQNGYETGTVNYEKRKRDLMIESDKEFASQVLKGIYGNLDRENKDLLLETSYDELDNEHVVIDTNYYREVAYNLEHTVHHMALIRVGINEISNMVLPEGYGVAASTMKHKKVCAQ